jgi:hypothetical protein
MIRNKKFSITDLTTITTRLERVRKKLKSPKVENFQIDLELISLINKLKLAITNLKKNKS